MNSKLPKQYYEKPIVKNILEQIKLKLFIWHVKSYWTEWQGCLQDLFMISRYAHHHNILSEHHHCKRRQQEC